MVAAVHVRSATLSPGDGSTVASPPIRSRSKSRDESSTGNGPSTNQSRGNPFSTRGASLLSVPVGRLAVAHSPSRAPRGIRDHSRGGLASGQRPVPLPRQPLTGSAASPTDTSRSDPTRTTHQEDL